MDEALVQQMLDELLSSLEPLEARSVALLQFIKARGIATDEELAPFLEQAGNTSNVRWRAMRMRMAALLSSAMKPSEQPVETVVTKEASGSPRQSKSKKESAENSDS